MNKVKDPGIITQQKKESDYQLQLVEDDIISISIMDILIVLSKHIKAIIIVPTSISIIAMIYVLFFTKIVYTTTAEILPFGSGESSISNLKGIAAQFGFSIPQKQENEIYSAGMYPKIIKSRILANELLVRKFNTLEFGYQKQLLQILTHGNKKPGVGVDTLKIYGYQVLKGMINVKKDTKTSVISINVSAPEPQFAADLALAIIEELDKFQQTNKKNLINEKLKFIQERILKVKNDLDNAENELKYFRESNRQMGDSAALLLKQERMVREIEIQKNIFIMLKQQIEITKIEEKGLYPMFQILESPEAPLKPSNQGMKTTVMIYGILGLFISLIYTFLKNAIDNRDSESIEKTKQIFQNIRKSIS